MTLGSRKAETFSWILRNIHARLLFVIFKFSRVELSSVAARHVCSRAVGLKVTLSRDFWGETLNWRKLWQEVQLGSNIKSGRQENPWKFTMFLWWFCAPWNGDSFQMRTCHFWVSVTNWKGMCFFLKMHFFTAKSFALCKKKLNSFSPVLPQKGKCL